MANSSPAGQAPPCSLTPELGDWKKWIPQFSLVLY